MNDELRNRLERACEGLYYISETDASFTVVTEIAERGNASGQRSFESFFAPMIAVRPGYGEEQVERAKKFLELKSLLEVSLTDLAVYEFGDVRKTIYIAGRDAKGDILALRTEAVET